jgi:hypothetical protein
MNEVMNVANGMNPVVDDKGMLLKEIVETLLDSYKKLPKNGQFALLGAGLVSFVGLAAYAMKQDYSLVKSGGGWQVIKC